MTPPTLKQIIEKATPGPWEHKLAGKEPNAPFVIMGDKPSRDPDAQWPKILVCYVYPHSEQHPSFPLKQEERDANAQLIARCSPSVMLAVVEALEAAKERIGQHRMSNYQHGAMEADAVDYDVQTKLFTALNALNGKAP